MQHNKRGFTIVELLIVIVVIGILSFITIVTFNGVQERSRIASRVSAIRAIQKGLEAYKSIHGLYPASTAMGTGGQPAGFTPLYGTGYEYSVATNDTWMKALITSGLVKAPILDPINNNDHHFIHLLWWCGVMHRTGIHADG